MYLLLQMNKYITNLPELYVHGFEELLYRILIFNKDRKQNWFYKKKLFNWFNDFLFDEENNFFIKPTKKNFIFTKKFYKSEKKWEINIYIKSDINLHNYEDIRKKMKLLVKFITNKKTNYKRFGGEIELYMTF